MDNNKKSQTEILLKKSEALTFYLSDISCIISGKALSLNKM